MGPVVLAHVHPLLLVPLPLLGHLLVLIHTSFDVAPSSLSHIALPLSLRLVPHSRLFLGTRVITRPLVQARITPISLVIPPVPSRVRRTFANLRHLKKNII